MIVSMRRRADVLRFASAITEDKDDPIAVRANALPMLQWLEAAIGPDDQDARWQALFRQHSNTSHQDPDDDPARFVASAEQYYAFLTA